MRIIKNLPQSKIIKKRRKFRFLLDSAFAAPGKFTKLSKKAKLIHQTADEDIYQKALEQNCFVLTVNFKDFKKFLSKEKGGIIGINSQLSNSQIDEIVTEFISGKNPDDLIGKAIKI